MSDKRSVATDALETLGTIIDDKQKRDAIHLAVEPVIAATWLSPGDHVDIRVGKAYLTDVGHGMGIVDPFLKDKVAPGQRFWFVMYPRMVHSLRHVWTHPEFPDEVGTPAQTPTIDKAASEAWLRKFCAEADCPDYETVMELIKEGDLPSPDSDYYPNGGSYTKNYLLFQGSDAHGEIPEEFWKHAEIVLGYKLENHPLYFSCSC